MSGRGEYATIHAALTDDKDFLALSPHAKLLVYTAKMRLGASGIRVVRAMDHQWCELTGLTASQFRSALAEVTAEPDPWLVLDYPVVWLRNGLKFNPHLSLENSRHVTSITRHLQGLPRLPIVNQFCSFYGLEPVFVRENARVQVRGEGDTEKDEVGIMNKESHTHRLCDSLCDSLSENGSAEPVGFAEFWASYPKRAGGNPRKRALSAYRARVSEAVDPAEVLSGLERYKAYLTATGKLGTEYVMQAATFVGPDRRWLEDWTPPLSTNGRPDLDTLVSLCRGLLDRADRTGLLYGQRDRVFGELEAAHPKLWADAGALFQRLRFRALVEETEGWKVDKELRHQLTALEHER